MKKKFKLALIKLWSGLLALVDTKLFKLIYYALRIVICIKQIIDWFRS